VSAYRVTANPPGSALVQALLDLQRRRRRRHDGDLEPVGPRIVQRGREERDEGEAADQPGEDRRQQALGVRSVRMGRPHGGTSLLKDRSQRRLTSTTLISCPRARPATSQDQAKRSPGRRQAATRDAIAAAARRQFGTLGYDATTIRAVAEEARVDPSLVLYFFGSKDALFTASIEWPFDPAVELPALIGDDPAGAGRRLVELFLKTWDAEARAATPSSRSCAPPWVRTRSAASSARSSDADPRPDHHRTRSDRPDLRASLVASQLPGAGIARHVLKFEPLASLDAASVADLVAPQIQRSLTGPLAR